MGAIYENNTTALTGGSQETVLRITSIEGTDLVLEDSPEFPPGSVLLLVADGIDGAGSSAAVSGGLTVETVG